MIFTDKLHLKFAANGQGRDFVVGDIHGCFEHLTAELVKVRFDDRVDRLFALGDLIDRGPQSMRAFEFLQLSWFYSIRGNHEVLLYEAYRQPATKQLHIQNGGGWFWLDDSVGYRATEKQVLNLNRLPVAITVGNTGLVHGEVPGNSWTAFTDRLDKGDSGWVDVALWERRRAKLAARASIELRPDATKECTIENIDAVYLGHTPLMHPVSAGNMHFIDSGCFATGNLTVREIQHR